MRRIKRFWCILRGFAIMMGVVFIIGLAFDHYANREIVGYFPATILSESMVPTLKTGDMVIFKDFDDVDEVKRGSIITYQLGNGVFITHRVIEITGNKKMIAYKTKGDANATEDKGSVMSEDIIGILYLKIPYVGYVIQFVKTPLGTIGCIVLLVGILVRFKI